MRIHFKTFPIKKEIPFNYQMILTHAIHKWLGINEIHDSISLYSFSWLMGGKVNHNGLVFPQGAQWFFNSFNNEILKKLITGIQKDPEIAFGNFVSDIIIQDYPQFERKEICFRCASPVFVKRTIKGKEIHFTFDQIESDHLLTETLKHKLQRAGLSTNGVSVEFNRNFIGAKTKVIYYGKIGNRVNICPVIITGTPEQLAFAWDVGVGNSTGIGFGSIN